MWRTIEEVKYTGGKAETYSPTPNELWVKARVDICGPASDRILGRCQLNAPTQSVDNGDEIYESANPTVGGG